MPDENKTVRYVIFKRSTGRPKSQGVCKRSDLPLIRANLPAPLGAKVIRNHRGELDLTPYDEILDPNRAADGGINAHRAGMAAALGKTVNDAITDVNDLDIE